MACLSVCFGTWRWAGSILVPANTVAAQLKGLPIGNNSDLYPRWFGSRELLLHHRDPYSAEVTRGIQRGFYGREIDPQKTNDPTDQVAFAYPAYVVFLLGPTLTLPFSAVQSLFSWLLLLGIAASVPAWMYCMGLPTKPLFVLSGMILAISTYPAVLEYDMQNLAALVAILLAFAALAASHEWLVLSGFFLALSTIKPQLSALFVLCFLGWTAGRWRERKRLAVSFMLTIAGLIAGAEMLLPHWIPEFLGAAHAYNSYATDPSILQFLFGSILSWIVALALCAAALFVAFRYRARSAGSANFGWIFAWAAVVTLTIVPIAVYNQVLLVPPLLLLLLERKRISGLLPRALGKATFACLGWQWLAATILAICSMFLSPAALRPFAKLPLLTLIAVPPLATLAILAGELSLDLTKPIPQALVARHE